MLKRLSLLISMLIIVVMLGATTKLQAEITPKINGPNLIQKEQYQVLTISDILALYSSNIGGVSIQEDNYTSNGAVLGIYEIELIASNGTNQAVKTIEIEVLSSIGYKVRAVTDKVNVHISKANKLLPVDIVQVHAKTGVLTLNSTSQFEILSNDYSENHDQPGSYLFEYRIMDATGLDKTISCYITVYDSERLESPIIIIPKESGPFEWIKKTLNTLFIVLVIGGIVYVGIKLFKKGRKSK